MTHSISVDFATAKERVAQWVTDNMQQQPRARLRIECMPCAFGAHIRIQPLAVQVRVCYTQQLAHCFIWSTYNIPICDIWIYSLNCQVQIIHTRASRELQPESEHQLKSIKHLNSVAIVIEGDLRASKIKKTCMEMRTQAACATVTWEVPPFTYNMYVVCSKCKYHKGAHNACIYVPFILYL